MAPWTVFALICTALALAAGCARTGLERDVLAEVSGVPGDTAPDIVDVHEGDSADTGPELDAPPDMRELVCPDDEPALPRCSEPMESEAQQGLCNGLDDDCDGAIDEGCGCEPGAVQACFAGPPGRVEVGACQAGTQVCVNGAEPGAGGVWGDCGGGTEPREEQCDGVDNDCDGCVDEFLDCTPVGSCPSPDDPRTPPAEPFTPYRLVGSDFYEGEAISWRWRIQGGVCDNIGAPEPSFTLSGFLTETAIFTPRLSGAYTVSLSVETPTGPFSCRWVIDVVGPGLRIEMCYPESTTRDLDLYMMRTTTPGDWFFEREGAVGGRGFTANPDACAWHNCEAQLRGSDERADWGYEPSPLAFCDKGPQGDQWTELGFCANPRLDIDNNLQEGTGLPENINVDRPRDGDGFRVMVQNWTGTSAHPVVNVYCAGRLTATFGAAPDQLPRFEMVSIQGDPGAMWRVADVFMDVDAAGDTLGCEVVGLNPPGQESGYDVTFGNPRF